MNAEIIKVFSKKDEHIETCNIIAKNNEIPINFSESALRYLTKAIDKPFERRDDLRSLPFITIDPEDARDHDDAIWAKKDSSNLNPSGWKIKIAIADVAHYVSPDSPIDKEALRRSNSVYFPNYVIPMLPELLSNNLCSLKSKKERPVLVAHITINSKGEKTEHYFSRSIISVVKNLSYEQVQKAADAKTNLGNSSYLEKIIKPLFEANICLETSKKKRNPLNLQSADPRFLFNDDGNIKSIEKTKTLMSNKLVENFMILANVCATETLLEKKYQCIYRIHEKPTAEKLEHLKNWLLNLNIKFPNITKINTSSFNEVIEQSKNLNLLNSVNQGVLRAQSQALYSTDNKGHFGLALRNYSHFTSPIRRYSDLIVHRLLISACNLGENGLENDSRNLDLISEKISNNERRALAAERSVIDIMFARYFSSKLSNIFPAYISDINTIGIFVILNTYGASGLIKYKNLGREYFFFNHRLKNVTGKNTGKIWRIGDKVKVKLITSDVLLGHLNFAMYER